MGKELSATFEDTFVYSTTVDDQSSVPRAVTIAFFSAAVPSGEDLGETLKEHFIHVPMSEELWLVTSAPNKGAAVALATDHDLCDRLERSSALTKTRVITFDGTGVWSEVSAGDTFELARAQEWVQTAGLRRLFKDTGALLDAHAGLHYIKPGGTHTRRFIRAAAATARSAHAHFIAAALLGWASEHTFERIWVDTASITGVGYALGELLHTLKGIPLPRVDSFGGHEGLSNITFTTPSIALISASTSGALSAAMREKDVDLDCQRTLFYIGSGTTQQILCDMTDREGDSDPDLVTPWSSYQGPDCPDCKNHQNAIVLKGDSFTPAPGLATPVTLITRYSDAGHKAFAKHFFQTGVISLNRSDSAADPTIRPVSIHLDEYIATAGGRKAIECRLNQFIPFRTRYIIHADTPDALAIAEIAKALCDNVGLKNVTVIPAKELATRKDKLDQGVSLVIAGVVSRGHDLLNISRQLRKLVAGGGDIAYFIGVLRPPGNKTWDTTQKNLTFRAESGKYPLEHCWYVETEPAGADNAPWDQEREILQNMKSWLRLQEAGHPVEAVIDRRILALNEHLKDRTAFLNSDHGAPGASMDMRLNPNFAFWDRTVAEKALNATHAEVYFTMSTVLHRARHSHDGKYSLFEQPGFGNVLAAENFDRFNDAVIQSALLRAARGRELRFEELKDESRRMANVVASALDHWDDVERGGAALEFILALIRGYEGQPGALSLAKKDVTMVLDAGDGISSTDAPLLELSLRYLAAAAS